MFFRGEIGYFLCFVCLFLKICSSSACIDVCHYDDVIIDNDDVIADMDDNTSIFCHESPRVMKIYLCAKFQLFWTAGSSATG